MPASVLDRQFLSTGQVGRVVGSGQLGGFGDGVPVVGAGLGAGEEVLWEILLHFGGGELVGPGDAGGGAGARAGGPGFGVVGGGFVGCAAPVVPAARIHFGGEFRVDENDAGVGAPGAAEADLARTRARGGRSFCGLVPTQAELGWGTRLSGGWRGRQCWRRFEAYGDFAREDDVAGGLIGRGARLGGDEAGAVGVEFVALEDGGGVAEDVVDAALDVGVNVILAAVVGEQRVLMPEEAAVFEDAAVATVGYSNGLAGVTGGVLEGDVIRFETRSVDLDGFGEEGAAGGAGVQRVGDDDFVGRFAQADQGDVVRS